MFNVGDYIIYGANGVCRIEKVGPLDSPNVTKDKIFYTICPCYIKGSTIFTPANNQKVNMRPVLTKGEAIELIDELKDIEDLWIEDEKGREQQYKIALRTCDCRQLVKIIKTIYTRKEERLAEGKKITATDEKYFRLAEESLYGELAISLGMSKEEVRDYVFNRVEQQA